MRALLWSVLACGSEPCRPAALIFRVDLCTYALGYTFELQFHTPEGMQLKMGESHHLYAEVRSPRRPDSERVKLYLQLKRLWDDLPVRSHIPSRSSCATQASSHHRCTFACRRCQRAWEASAIAADSKTERWKRFF